jgi:hypothetical protein
LAPTTGIIVSTSTTTSRLCANPCIAPAINSNRKSRILVIFKNKRIDIVCKNNQPPHSLQMFSDNLAIIHTTKEKLRHFLSLIYKSIKKK